MDGGILVLWWSILSNGDWGGGGGKGSKILIKCDRCLACVGGRLRADIDTNGVCLTASVSFWRGLGWHPE